MSKMLMVLAVLAYVECEAAEVDIPLGGVQGREVSAVPTFDLSNGKQHMFRLKDRTSIHELYKSDATSVDRTWSGGQDLSGTVPVSIGKDGQLVVDAWMCDDQQGAGDRLVLLADGKEIASGRVIKRTKSVSDYRIEATIPRTNAVLEIRIEDDDGKGVDGWATTGAFKVVGLSPIRFATPFGDGMILQRDRKVPVWGTADAGAKVEVSFAGQVKTAVTDQTGKWRVDLDPMPASKTGRMLTATSQTAHTSLSDILVGEVWIVSGQSNCELPLVGKHPHFSDREGIMMANMTHRPFIRFAYASTYRYSLEPRAELRERAIWKEFNPKNLKESPSFSAMGVYFALAIESEIQVPIGLIGVYWGGTRIEPWIPIEALKGVKGSEWCFEAEPVVDSQWRKEMFGGRLKWPNSQPSVLWNDMIAPWCPMAARGILWYQGCSNAKAGQFEMNDNYRLLMHALYDSWSKRFEQSDLKLYFVQIAPWPWNHWDVQLAQAKFAEEERNAAMVTICDIGNLFDIHPNEKGTVGRRLALLALRHDYGFTDLVADAPVLETCIADGNQVKMTFKDASAFWLYHRDWSVDVPFELAADDGKWAKAHLVNTINGCTNTVPWKSKGAIDGGRTLVVAAPNVAHPARVRYLREKAGEGFIYSVDSGLPIGPFESKVKSGE